MEKEKTKQEPKYITHIEAINIVEKIVDDKMSGIASDLKELTSRLLGSDEDKKWNRPSFVDDVYEMKQKVDFTFRRMNEIEWEKITQSNAYVGKLKEAKALESVKEWQTRDLVIKELSDKIGAKNLAQWISLLLSIITLATVIITQFLKQ